MKWLRFFFSHSVFISICAAALCFQTHILLGVEIRPLVYVLVFSSTLSGYNLYWLISKFHFSRHGFSPFLKRNISNILILLLGTVSTVYCLVQLPYLTIVFTAGVLLTILYSLPLWPFRFAKKLHKLGFLKTLLLAFTWTYITVMIPVTGHNVSATSICSLFLARFFFMLMLCAIFDSRDIAIDKMNNLRSLATDVSRRDLQMIMIISFTLYMLAGFFLRYNNGSELQLWAFSLTGLLTFLIYRLSIIKRGYFFYYFLVDGLMLFSAVLTYLASIG